MTDEDDSSNILTYELSGSYALQLIRYNFLSIVHIVDVVGGIVVLLNKRMECLDHYNC